MNEIKWTRAWHQQQVDAYSRERPTYKIYATLLQRILSEACKRYAGEGHAFSRAKEPASFAEKAVRKCDRYPDPIHQFTDLCGGRVVVLTQAEADRVAQFVRHNFLVDEDNSEDVRTRLKPDQFGYRAIHYVVQMPWFGLLGHGQCREMLEHFSRESRRDLRQLLQRVANPASDKVLRDLFFDTFRAGDGNSIYEAIEKAVPPLMESDGVQMLRSAVDWTLEKENLDRNSRLELMCRIGNRKAEIQVQTLLQHAWSAISHDRLYKTSFHPPRQLERQLTRVAALLEEGDEQFSQAISELQTYQLDYGSYLSPEEIERELAKWQAVAQPDRTNLTVTLKIAEYARAIEGWDAVIDALEPLEITEDPRVLRLLGLARSRTSGTGRETLRRARVAAPRDPSGLYLLGSTYCKQSVNHEKGAAPDGDHDCARALSLYEEALDGHSLEAAFSSETPLKDPHVFRKYAECLICCGRFKELCNLVTPSLEAAWALACRRSEVHVRAPESLYDMGFFALLLGRPSVSLGAYAKAVFLSSTAGPIGEELEVLTRLRARLKKAHTSSSVLRNWACTIRFLQLAKLAKLQQIARLAPEHTRMYNEQLGASEKELTRLEADLQKLQREHAARLKAQRAIRGEGQAADKGVSSQVSAVREMHHDVEAAQEAVKDAKREVACARQQLKRARKLEKTSKMAATVALKELKATAPTLPVSVSRRLPFSRRKSPVMILVGACDPGSESLMQSYRPLLLNAFAGFHGTLCSGGTKSGIAALAGEIQVSNRNSVRTVGYLPNLKAGKKNGKIPKDVKEDTRYKTLVPTRGDDFSALEPLRYWTDIIVAGIEPHDVRILGINGGKIAALEYRLALAFDASVAVLERSGREAARLLQNEEWGLAERLMILPPEAPVVKAYVRAGSMAATGDLAALSTALAPDVHADYVQLCAEQQRKANPSLCRWNELAEDLKESNYQQVLHWADHLAQIGYSVKKASGLAAPPLTLTPAEIEALAEIEHARYLVERFLKGWRWGEKRDNDKKINPTLIGWGKLPETEKEKDRAAVTNIIRHFEAKGFQIMPARRRNEFGGALPGNAPQ